jgi:acetyl esterase/lipase
MNRALWAAVIVVSALSAAQGQHAGLPQGIPAPVFLWPHGVPGALGQGEEDKPRMYAFLPQKRSTSAAVLVIPGGGYQHLAIGYEGAQIAGWLNQQGIPAFLLDYRVAPYHFPAPVQDAQRAMQLIRLHAAEYGVDPHRIGVWGASAGGHLASTLGTHGYLGPTPETADDPANSQSTRPDFMVLEYPVISMEMPESHQGSHDLFLGPSPKPGLAHEYSNQFAVTKDTPPTFIFATTNDPTVPVANSLDFYRALVDAHVHAELHLYDYANHGCGLCGSIVPLSNWPGLLRNWLVGNALLPSNAPSLPPPMPNLPAWIEGLTGPGQFDGHW